MRRGYATTFLDNRSPTDAILPVGERGDAFASFYRQYVRRVRGVVRRHVRDPHLVEDVVQETFLRAWRSKSSLDPDRDPWRWLAVTARRLCRDHYRRASTVREDPGSPEIEKGARTGAGPEERCIAEEHRLAVREALGRLNPRHRRLLVLREIQGTAYDEIASVEGASVNALKLAAGRAREAFRHAYAAVTQERGLNVAAWPLVGALMSRWRSVRIRMQDQMAQLSGAVMAGGTAQVALVAGAVSMVLIAALAVEPSDSSRGIDQRPAVRAEASGATPAATLGRSDGGPGTVSGFEPPAAREDVADVAVSVDEVANEPPVSGGASVALQRDEEQWTLNREHDGSAGDDDSSGRGRTWVECESGSMTTAVLCEALDVSTELVR